MDVRSWRKVLLQWITECNFMDHNYFNIEQTNIDAFFRNFCLKHTVTNGQESLISFLETYYPDFQPHVDDENALSAADYIYIYSLLLHFSCVKYPDEHFHGICQKLTEQAQQCIAAFFKHLLDCSVINKEHLRHTIAEVAECYMNSPPVQQNKNESISSNSSSSIGPISVDVQTSFSSSPLRSNGDSPLRTPNRKVITATQRISPTTPKTYLLEERTRELYNYKAQLETERYEKGLLELQIKQNEHQIHTLNQVQKKLHQQIQALKDEILNQSIEPNRSHEEDEQLKRRLYRQINEREDEIFRLNDRIRNSCEEKTLLENKMRHAERKVMDYRETIHALELRLNEQEIELEKRETTIKCLTVDKHELEHFIAESRTASSNSRPDFNSSNDCLDSSFTRFTNSSSSLGSPENLGVSVVDVQLREKEHENAQLRDELDEMRAYNKKLFMQIQEKTNLYKKEHNFEIINADLTIDKEDPAAEFSSFVDCMNHLTKSYKEAMEVIKVFENDVCSLQANNDNLRTRIDEAMHEIQHLKENLRNAENKNETYQQEIENLKVLKNELAQNYDATVNDFQEKLRESNRSQEQLKSYIEGLNEKIRLQMCKIETLDKLEIKLQNDNKELEKNCEDLRDQLHQFQKLNQTLQDTVELQNSKLASHVEAERTVKKKYEQLLVQNEEILKKSRDANMYLETMSAELKTKEEELSKLGRQIVQLGKTNGELEDRIVHLTQNFDIEKSKSDAEIQKLHKSRAEVEKQLENKCNDLRSIKSEMEEICKETTSLYTLLVENAIVTDKCTVLMQLNKIQEIVAIYLKDQREKSKKILEMENNSKQSYEKFQELGVKIREQAEDNEKILSKQKEEIGQISERLQNAHKRIEQLEELVKNIKENHEQVIVMERKRIEELENIVKNLNSKHDLLKEEQNEERRHWQTKKEQLEAELNGEKEINAAKDSELSQVKQQLKTFEHQLNQLRETREEDQKEFTQKITIFEDKVQALNKENVNLQSKLQSKAEILTSKINEINLQTEKYEQTIRQVKTSELELEHLKTTLKNKQIEHEEIIAACEKTIKTIKSEKEQIESTLKQNQAILAAKVSEFDALNETNKKTMQQLKEVEFKSIELKKNIESAQNNYTSIKQDLETKIQELTKQNTELQKSMESSLKAEKDALASKLCELETCTENLNKTLEQLKIVELQRDELQKNFDSLKHDSGSKIRELTKKNSELQTSKQNLEANLKTDAEKGLAQQQQIEFYKQELEIVESRLQALQKIYVSEQVEFKEKIAKLEENAEILISQNETYSAKVQKLKENESANKERLLKADADISALKKELEKATAMVTDRNKKLQESQEMLTVASQKLEDKTKIWKSMHLTCEKQSEELEVLRKKTVQLEKLHQKQCLECKNLSSTTKKQSEELFGACEEIERLKKLDNNNSKRIKKLQAQLENTKTECANIKAKLEQVSKDNKEKNQKLQEFEKSMHDLNTSITEKDQNVEQLRGLLKETETCLKNVNGECTKLQSDIVSKEAELCMINDELKQVRERSKTELDNAFGVVRDIEEAIIDISNLLENGDANNTVKPAKELDMPCVLRLNEAINKVLVTITQQQSALQEIPHLQSRLTDISNQYATALNECKTLKSECVSAKETIEYLENQKRTLERNITNDQQRFTKDMENLKEVNEKFTQENATLQLKLSNLDSDLETTRINYVMLNAINERLRKEQDSVEEEYTKTIDALNSERQHLKETINDKEIALKEFQQKFNELQRSATEDEALLQQNLLASQNDLKKSIAEKTNLQQELLAEKEACTALASKCQDLEIKNAELNTQAVELQKECMGLRVELAALNENWAYANKELASTISQLDEAKSNNSTLSNQLAEFSTKHQQLERSIKNKDVELNSANFELSTLMQKKDTLIEEKEKLSQEYKSIDRECQDLKKTIHNLNQKLALSDLEKDDLRRQLELLHKQVEVNGRYQTTSESKLKNIVETSQKLERNLLSSENALKTALATIDQSKLNIDKLDGENKKLRDNFETLNKRVEKMALKLGETQGHCDKLERENEKLLKGNEGHASTIEMLQRDKEIQQLECKTLRDRLNKMERLHEQYSAKVQTAEKSNATLIAAKKKLEESEVDLKSKITKLENSRQIIEERLRKMTQDYEHYERENVNLNHQIGALNNEIQTLKNVHNANNNETIKNFNAAQERAVELEERNKQLLSECSEIRQQNQCVTDQLSKLVLALEISKTKTDQMNVEVQQLEFELNKLHHEKQSLEQEKSNAVTQLEEKKNLYEKVLTEKSELTQKLLSYENDMIAKVAEIFAMRKEITDFRQKADDNSTRLVDKATDLVAEVESLRTRLLAGEVMLEKEQENNAKLRSDNQILQAKYREAKQRAENEISNREERIKENRLELEGKLEKMKNKMKVLYTEEITKMKAKHERETGTLRSELSILKAQNSKFEEHTRKLSAEIMTLNDRMLEFQKENTYLLTKLKYPQTDAIQFKRPNGPNSQTSTSTLPRLSNTQSISANMGGDLAMEDEEGEIFNNTYLTDMKNGRMSIIGPEELQHRNSLLPPHLKSSYAVQYDHGLCEDEVKDSPSNGFDDSMSALISKNNSNCMRKKIIGVTHYRKPGPPTPSKNGGRLSFGSNSEPTREILKESYDENVHQSSSRKTPTRFSIFGSRFSMGNINTTRDEKEDLQENQQQQKSSYHQQDQQLRTNVVELNPKTDNLRRALQIRNLEKLNQIDSIEQCSSKTKICTSTPRKSRGRQSLDKRRLINEMLQQTPAATDTSISPQDITAPEISAIETPTLNNGRTRRQSFTFVKFKNSKIANSRYSMKGKTFSTGSSTGATIAALQRRIRKRQRREQGGRPSLCVHKNLYSNKVCTPQRGALRDLKRIMGRKQRMLRFDKQRMVMNTSSSAVEESDIDVKDTPENEINPGQNITVVDGNTFDVNNSKSCRTIVLVNDKIEDFQNTECSRYELLNSDEYYQHNETTVDTQTYRKKKNVDGATKIITTAEFNTFNEHLERLCMEENTSSVCFEQLLKETVSQAPFKIRNIRLSSIGTTQSDSGMTTTKSSTSGDNLSDRCLNAKSFASSACLPNSKNSIKSSTSTSDAVFTAVAASPHQSLPSPSSMLLHSRTIYGASVIFNRRIPNVGGLSVRKSSIYFKNPKCSTFRTSCGLSAGDSNDTNMAGFSQDGDLILVTNQTITLYDLICMWHQMNVWTRGVVSVIILGCMGAIAALLYIACYFR